MENKSITIFTPTFNRAHLLPRLYASLCEQSVSDFLWMVIDDGSLDGTKELVERWQDEGKIQIMYFYKQNGGMHTGHNLAYQNIKTELNVCIDSDDWMPPNAIELILEKWKAIDNKNNIAGIIGLDALDDGQIVGTPIPEHLIQGGLNELYNRHGVKGDKKLVLRTDVIHQYPAYPKFEGEKLVPLGTLYLMIEQDYDFVYANEVYCIVEYQEDGSSNSILRQYKQSPRGFAYSKKYQIKYEKGFLNLIKYYIHLISSSLFVKDLGLMFRGVNPLASVILFPLGVLMYLYVNFKIKYS